MVSKQRNIGECTSNALGDVRNLHGRPAARQEMKEENFKDEIYITEEGVSAK
jgi:hypothetical protein